MGPFVRPQSGSRYVDAGTWGGCPQTPAVTQRCWRQGWCRNHPGARHPYRPVELPSAPVCRAASRPRGAEHRALRLCRAGELTPLPPTLAARIPRIFPFPWCRCILFLSTSLRVKWNNVSLIDGWQFRTQMSLCLGTEAGPCGCLCSPDARNPILTKQSAPGKSCCNRFGQVFSLCWMFVFLCSGSPPTRFSRDRLHPEVKVGLAPTSVLKVTTVLGLQNPHGRVFPDGGQGGSASSSHPNSWGAERGGVPRAGRPHNSWASRKRGRRCLAEAGFAPRRTHHLPPVSSEEFLVTRTASVTDLLPRGVMRMK